MMRSFCRYIVAQLPDLVIGTTLHKGTTPQGAPALCTTVLERVPGRPNPYNADRKDKHYQLLTRGASYEEGETEAKRIFNAVINLRAIDMTPYAESGEDVYTLYITEGNEPAYVGEDEKGRFLFSSNLTLRVKKES